MKYIKATVVSLFSAFALAGCDAAPPLDFSMENIQPVVQRKNAEMKSLNVGFAPQSQQRILQTNESLPPIWKEGLSDALERSLIFRDDSRQKVNVSVRITEVDSPEFGFDLTTRVAAIYEVIDRNSGALLFAEEIQSEGTVPLEYSLNAFVRARESGNRAIRNNIADFINKLQAADFSRPVYR